MKASDGSAKASKRAVTAYWIFTALFALQMGFTAYAHLRIPQAAQVFARLGFPDYFRVELCVAKLLGIAVLILPMAPAVLKEWAYAAFAIVLVSALIAHLAVGDGAAAWNERSCCGLLFRKLNRGVARLGPSRGRADHEVCGVLNRAGFAGGHLV